jgi:hypothetical protein
MTLDDCTTVLSDDCRSIASFEENGMIYRGINNMRKRVIRYQVDCCEMPRDIKRCDNAIELPTCNNIYFIELKGEDIKKAAVQILCTINLYGRKLDGNKIFARIVCSRIPRPDIRSSQIVSLERAVGATGGNLTKTCRKLEESI